eukprot:5738875-Prymnesium_polylepis.2
MPAAVGGLGWRMLGVHVRCLRPCLAKGGKELRIIHALNVVRRAFAPSRTPTRGTALQYTRHASHTTVHTRQSQTS